MDIYIQEINFRLIPTVGIYKGWCFQSMLMQWSATDLVDTKFMDQIPPSVTPHYLKCQIFWI